MIISEEAIQIDLIPQRPNSGCPMGTFDSVSTCYCEDHCSWESCKLFHPPQYCLEHMNGDAVWGWYQIFVRGAHLIFFNPLIHESDI